jgi:hypothetical protein
VSSAHSPSHTARSHDAIHHSFLCVHVTSDCSTTADTRSCLPTRFPELNIAEGEDSPLHLCDARAVSAAPRGDQVHQRLCPGSSVQGGCGCSPATLAAQLCTLPPILPPGHLICFQPRQHPSLVCVQPRCSRCAPPAHVHLQRNGNHLRCNLQHLSNCGVQREALFRSTIKQHSYCSRRAHSFHLLVSVCICRRSFITLSPRGISS